MEHTNVTNVLLSSQQDNIQMKGDKPKEKLEDVMKDLEQKYNPSSTTDGITKLNESIKNNDPTNILAPIQSGAKEFEERTGRKMTYAEMRAMWG